MKIPEITMVLFRDSIVPWDKRVKNPMQRCAGEEKKDLMGQENICEQRGTSHQQRSP
jgi:hypothetical protein